MSYHPQRKNSYFVSHHTSKNKRVVIHPMTCPKYASSTQKSCYYVEPIPSASKSQSSQDHQGKSKSRLQETIREFYPSSKKTAEISKANQSDGYIESSLLFEENVQRSMSSYQTSGQSKHETCKQNAPEQLDDKETNITNISINMPKDIHLGMPVLKLEVITNDDYHLDETDVIDLFSRYGRVVKVIVKASKTAYIVYNDIMSAFYAQKSLNGLYLKDIGAKLVVNQCDPNQEEWNPEDLAQLHKIQLNAHETLNTWNKEITSIPKRTTRPLPNLPLDIPAFPYTPVKFTCKYEIQIENDREFQVARRLIGPRGCNMKLILMECQTLIKNLKLVNEKDLLKLRLRGKGSGFLEGPEKIESEEPMHLCVSSKYMEIYKMACVKIEELLMKIYQDYQRYCKKRERSAPVLDIRRLEDYNEPNIDNNNI